MANAGEGNSNIKTSSMDATGCGRLLLWGCGHRVITALIFVCTLVAYWERVGFSIAFTDIATKFGLSETEKGYVFAVYYSGYALTQIPAGYMTRRYGGKATLALSFLLWSPASILMVLPSRSPDHVVSGFIACRLVIGMAQGMLVPACQSVLGHWVPPESRGRYFAFAMAGKFAGATIAMVTVPIIVSNIDAPTTFYVTACMGAAWLAVWMCAGSDAPRGGEKEPEWLVAAQSTSGSFALIHRNSVLERTGSTVGNSRVVSSRNGREGFVDSRVQAQTIPAFGGQDPAAAWDVTKDTTRPVFGRGGQDSAAAWDGTKATERPVFGRSSQAKSSPFPWKAMSRSPAAWACVTAGVGAGTGINVVMSWLPTYFEELFLVELKDLGLVSLLAPYLTMMVFSVLGGIAYCWLINTRGTSVPRASKVITGLSFALAVGCFFSLGLATSSTIGIVISSLALASLAFSRGGWSTYHLEIAAPEHAAMLFSIANSSGSGASVAGITVVGKLLDAFGGSGESLAWIVAMGAIGAICGSCGVYFVIFAQGDDILFPATPEQNFGANRWPRGIGRGREHKVEPRRDEVA